MLEHGNLEYWYAEDDEGNAHHEVHYSPSLYYVDEDCNVYSCIEDAEYCVDIKDIRAICIVN